MTDRPLPQDFEYMQAQDKRRQADKPASSFTTICTNTIMETEYPPVAWVVPDYLPEGFAVLAGRQKLGKTWLAIDLAIAVASGGAAMGEVFCEAGDVLYIDMENGPKRIQNRIGKLFPNPENRPDLSRLQWAGDVIGLERGFIGAIDEWRRSQPNPRLIVIDVLQRVKPAGKGNKNAYENDYSIFSPLQSWAREHGIAVLALHHTRKGGADDPLEALTGSNGLSACADTTLVLNKDGNGITLYVRGRDVAEKETALIFEGGIWTMIGDAVEARRSTERSRILSALQTADDLMTPAELVAATGMKRNNLDQLLHRMCQDGEVLRPKRGNYCHPDRSDLYTPASPHKNDKIIRSTEELEANTLKALDVSNDPQSYNTTSKAGAVRSPKRKGTSNVENELPEIPEFLRRTRH